MCREGAVFRHRLPRFRHDVVVFAEEVGRVIPRFDFREPFPRGVRVGVVQARRALAADVVELSGDTPSLSVVVWAGHALARVVVWGGTALGSAAVLPSMLAWYLLNKTPHLDAQLLREALRARGSAD